MNHITKLLFVCGVLAGAPLGARVTVAPIYASGMVVQRGQPAPVRGAANPGEAVTVVFAGQESRTVAGADGRWQVTLNALKASREPQVMTIAGETNRIELKDVLVGEVWLCVGQSNMAFRLDKALGSAEFIATADRRDVRVFNIHFNSAPAPEDRVSGGWARFTPANAGRNSAVASYFAGELNGMLGVPVGIFSVALSGSYAEVWFSREAQADEPATRDYLAAWDWLEENVKVLTPAVPGGAKAVYADKAGHVIDTAAYAERFKVWQKNARAALEGNEPPPADFPLAFLPLRAAPRPDDTVIRPAGGFNGSIFPLIPTAFRGVVWYQGESHFVAERYGAVLRALVKDWRARFDAPELAFLVVGLPNWGKSPAAVPVEPPETASWPWVREQQHRVAAELPGVFVTVNTDTAIPDKGDLHPANKAPVGRRLALAAARHVYGLAVEGDSPAYSGMKPEGDAVRIIFSNTDGGLAAPASGIVDLPADPSRSAVPGFAVAGEDRRWHWARASIDGETVVVSSPDVPQPVAVRYNWANYPVGTVFGARSGLPLAPFRTDDWNEQAGRQGGRRNEKRRTNFYP